MVGKSSIEPSNGVDRANSSTQEDLQSSIYSGMSYSKKWEVFLQLRETAWRIKAAGLSLQHPEWNQQEIEDAVRNVFLNATT